MATPNLEFIVSFKGYDMNLFVRTRVQTFKNHVLGLRSMNFSEDEFLTIDHHGRIIRSFAQLAIEAFPSV